MNMNVQSTDVETERVEIIEVGELEKESKKRKSIDTISFLKSTKKDIYNAIAQHEDKIKGLKLKLKNIDKTIYQICEHEWKPEPQRYASTEFYCSKCSMYK